MNKTYSLLILFFFFGLKNLTACSILYFIDSNTGKIYAVNNEDYWYNVKPYIQILPKDKKGLARLWYGWDNFAQGGINEEGLYFDGASTPEQSIPKGYGKPTTNLGDDILAKCTNVTEAVTYIENKKIALKNGHILIGDKTGNAVVIEWVKGIKNIVTIKNNTLMVTNFLLSDTTAGNYPCYRYGAMEEAITKLQKSEDSITLKEVGNVVAKAVQFKSKNEKGKEGGTLYSTFINITDMNFILIYKVDNSKITKLDLKAEFLNKKKKRIKLN